MNMKKLAPIQSLAQLNTKAQRDERYKNLAIVAANNLGGAVKEGDYQSAIRWLKVSAMESDEDGVVEEVNFCLDLV